MTELKPCPNPWRRFDREDPGTWPEKFVNVFVWLMDTGPTVTFHDGERGFHRFSTVTHWAPMSIIPAPDREEG